MYLSPYYPSAYSYSTSTNCHCDCGNSACALVCRAFESSCTADSVDAGGYWNCDSKMDTINPMAASKIPMRVIEVLRTSVFVIDYLALRE